MRTHLFLFRITRIWIGSIENDKNIKFDLIFFIWFLLYMMLIEVMIINYRIRPILYGPYNMHKLYWISFVKLWRKLLKTRCSTYYQLHTVVDHGSLWLLWSKLTPFQTIFTSLAVLITFCKWLNTQNPESEIRFHKKTRRFGLRLTTRILLVDLLVVWSDRILHYFTFCTTLEVQYTNSINLGQVWLPVPEKRVSV